MAECLHTPFTCVNGKVVAETRRSNLRSERRYNLVRFHNVAELESKCHQIYNCVLLDFMVQISSLKDDFIRRGMFHAMFYEILSAGEEFILCATTAGSKLCK